MEDANPCIQMVSTVFRMYPSFDLFMIEHFEDGFLVGVDYYDIDGYMVDTYYFKVYIYDGDNGFYMFMHVTEDPYQFNQDFYNHMNLLGTLLMDIPTNMTQICDEFFYMITDCATELQPYLTTELTGAYQTEFFSRFDEFNNESFYARIRFEYSDGSWIHNEYLVYFEYHETLGLRASLELRGSEMSIPSDAVFQPLTQTTNILTQFVNGYQNSTVSDDDLCHTFFMDSTMNGECLEGRAEFLLAGGTATLTSIEELFDTEGVEYYLAHFTLTTGTETEEIYQAVRVYLLSNGLFYIDFLDMQPEISLDDFVARYTKYLLEWNDHFNTTSGVCAEFFEINDSSCAPNRDAAIAANGVLTAVEYYNIEIINDVIYYSVSISVMYSDVTQNESGYEVYTAHYGDSGEIVFVPANFPN